MADMFSFDMRVGPLRGVTVDVSTVHNFHGSADNPSLNGTLRHQDLDLALSQRAQAKVDISKECRFNEYVIFHSDQTYAEYLLAGERI